MRATLAATWIAAFALLAACSTVERGTAAPSDADSPVTIESAARLGQMLLLVPVATCSACGESSFTGSPDVTVDPTAIAGYLRDWKDYEVALVPEDAETNALVTDLAAWHEHLEKSEPMPPPLQARLEALTRARAGHTAADTAGVLVIHSHIRLVSATDMTLYFMIVGMPNMFKKMFERNTSIALYDPRRGELLWASFFHAEPNQFQSLQQYILREMENLPAAARHADAPD
jgi:hypothetical protein